MRFVLHGDWRCRTGFQQQVDRIRVLTHRSRNQRRLTERIARFEVRLLRQHHGKYRQLRSIFVRCRRAEAGRLNERRHFGCALCVRRLVDVCTRLDELSRRRCIEVQ